MNADKVKKLILKKSTLPISDPGVVEISVEIAEYLTQNMNATMEF